LNFGDGSAVKTGSFGGASSASMTHTYAAGGVFRATLTVTDEVGTVSTNLAEETITVAGDEVKSSDASGSARLGGGLPAATLLLLGLLGLGRRRAVQAGPGKPRG